MELVKLVNFLSDFRNYPDSPCFHTDLGGGGGGQEKSVSHSVISNPLTQWTVTRQAHLSMEFFRQEYWNGLSFPSPGNPPKSRDRTRYNLSHQGEALLLHRHRRNSQLACLTLSSTTSI